MAKTTTQLPQAPRISTPGKSRKTKAAPLRQQTGLTAVQYAQQLLLDKFTPAAVLIDSKQDILYYYGTLNPYLVQPRGTPTHHLLSRAREGLATPLRLTLQALNSNSRQSVAQEILLKRGQRFVPAKFTILPISHNAVEAPLYLIVFEDLPPLPEDTQTQLAKDPLIRQLELELRTTRDDLHAALMHVEGVNAELKSTNEELNAVNEELRSSNEELESSHEELQALNDELQSLNQQLQEKVDALENTNDYLNNLLVSSDIATLYLDKKLRIKWLTPGMQSVFNLLESDIGRPIQDFSQALVGDGLVEDAKQVLKNAAPRSKEIKLINGHWYQRRILPFRSESQRVNGVTITFTDITDAKRNAETLEQRVMERTADLRALTVALSLTEERERRALAVDLHDNLGQVLAAAKIKLATLSKLEPAALVPRCREISALLDQAHNTIRSMTFQLSPPVLHELGLLPALEWLADEMRRLYDLDVLVRHNRIPQKLDSALNTLLFRSVRELLINVAKHAKVNQATVDIQQQDKTMIIVVADAGGGLPKDAVAAHSHIKKATAGFGLFSIRERLHHIGGTMQIDSNPEQGTAITLSVPLMLPGRQRKPRKD